MMKKAMILIASAIVCLSASAQVQFGFKVGVDATNFWGKMGDVPPATYPWIVNHSVFMSYGAGVKILSPKIAVSFISQQLSQAAANYNIPE